MHIFITPFPQNISGWLLLITEDRGEIIQLLTIVFCDLSIFKNAVFNVSEYTARQARELRLQKEILSVPEQKQRVGISQENKQTDIL